MPFKKTIKTKKMKQLLTLTLTLTLFMVCHAQTAQFDRVSGLSVIQIPRYSSLTNATAAGSRPGNFVFVYAGVDSGVHVRSFDNSRWIKINAGGGGGGGGLTPDNVVLATPTNQTVSKQVNKRFWVGRAQVDTVFATQIGGLSGFNNNGFIYPDTWKGQFFPNSGYTSFARTARIKDITSDSIQVLYNTANKLVLDNINLTKPTPIPTGNFAIVAECYNYCDFEPIIAGAVSLTVIPFKIAEGDTIFAVPDIGNPPYFSDLSGGDYYDLRISNYNNAFNNNNNDGAVFLVNDGFNEREYAYIVPRNWGSSLGLPLGPETDIELVNEGVVKVVQLNASTNSWVNSLFDNSRIYNSNYINFTTFEPPNPYDSPLYTDFKNLGKSGIGIGLEEGFIKARDLNSDTWNIILPRRYTPTNSNDAFGKRGDRAYDDNYLYIKTSAGWKRVSLSTF
jgi:hypothetical protein